MRRKEAAVLRVGIQARLARLIVLAPMGYGLARPQLVDEPDRFGHHLQAFGVARPTRDG
jgi:hypothetical protein